MKRAELNAKVAQVVCSVLGDPDLLFSLDLVNAGLLDQLSQLELAYALEDAFDIQVSDSEIDGLRSLRSAADCVARKITVVEEEDGYDARQAKLL